MAIILPKLPYAVDALEPAISSTTLEVHHGKHHKAYVDKTNTLVSGTDHDGKPLEQIIVAAAKAKDQKLYNQAAQAWNHGFYWNSLSPEATKPDDSLLAALEAAFGSTDDAVSKLAEQGETHFGSGWAWLMADGDALSVTTTHDAGCPIGESARPLLVIDVWEHAYYLDRKNDRKAYLKAIADRINWTFASENFARKDTWTYPS